MSDYDDPTPLRRSRSVQTAFFVFLLATALTLAPAAHAQQGVPPIARARANAQSFLSRMVQLAAAPTASEAVQTGFGFIVGERVTAKGEPGFLIVTADHLVRGASNPQRPSAVRVRFYADTDVLHRVPAEVLDAHLPPPEGDLAVLSVPKPSIRPLSPAAIGSQALAPGMAAWQLGLADQWTTPEATGRFGLHEPTGWLDFDDFDGSPEAAGGAVITEFGLAGMVVGRGSQAAASVRVLPVELIAAKFREWGLPWNLSGTRATP